MAFRGNGTREALGTARRAAGGAVLFVVAVGTLAAFLRHGVASRVALDSYAPPMIPPPRKGGSAEGASRSGAGAGESHEYAGRPTDWRRKQETGRHPNEANVGVDENTDALENLLKAAGGGQILDPGTAAARVQAAREEAGEVMDERRDEVAEEEMETPSGRSCCGGMGPEEMKAVHGLAVHTFDPLLAGDRHKFSGMINAPHNPMESELTRSRFGGNVHPFRPGESMDRMAPRRGRRGV